MDRLVVTILLVALLAGCSGPGTGAGTPDGGALAGSDSIALPTWTVGDWWTWQSPQIETPYTHVVTGETAGDYLVDTDNPEIAFFNARFDVSMMGPIRKTDLAGSQGSGRVEFLHFPLVAHKNWTTPWDGMTMSVHVMSIEDGVAMIHASRPDGTLHAMYTFKNETGHFGLIQYFAPDGATLGFEATVTKVGTGYSGPLVRYELDAVVDLHGPIPPGQSTTYIVPSTITDVYVAAVVNCTAGNLVIATGPPQGPVENRGYSSTDPCPKQENDAYVAAPAPAQDETWGLVLTSAPGATTGTLDLTVWLRTLHEYTLADIPPPTR